MKKILFLLLLLLAHTAYGKKVPKLAVEGDITQEMAEKLTGRLAYLDSQGCGEVYILINSLGGDADAALSIYDAMAALKPRMIIHTHCVNGVGFVASLLLVGGTPGYRYACEKSSVMINLLKSGSDDAADVEHERKINDRIIAILAADTGHTAEEIVGKLSDVDDVWFFSDAAQAYGIVDKVLPPGQRLGGGVE